MSSYYDILKIPKNATDNDIKKAYRNLAKEFHPDKGGDKETFQKIQEAYDVLSDSKKRAEYDSPNPFENIFENAFNSGFPFNFFGKNNMKMKKNNTYYEFKIKLDDVFTGLKKTFNLKRSFECKFCKINCTKCGGKGSISQRVQFGNLIQIMNTICDNCNGKQKIQNNDNCNACMKKGFIYEEKKIEINIPKGVENGKEFTFKDWGEQSNNPNEISGDFVIKIIIENHDKFTRNGLNLYINEKLTFRESIVGKIINIKYFSEDLKIETKLLGIINPNKEYILQNKGLEDIYGKKGNLHIRFTIDYPDKKLSNDEITMLNNILKTINL
jgi:DnaJ-class molecular chaperone